MNLDNFKNALPDFAKDIKLNIGSVLSLEGAPDLTLKQIHLIALSSGYSSKQSEIYAALQDASHPHLDEAEIHAAKSAATIMAMNNIYYRFTHMVSDTSFSTMPAKLRMNVLANPGIEKIDFELCCLAASALNGCGMCIEAHTQALIKAGMSKQAIQSCIRIAAVINAAALGMALA